MKKMNKLHITSLALLLAAGSAQATLLASESFEYDTTVGGTRLSNTVYQGGTGWGATTESFTNWVASVNTGFRLDSGLGSSLGETNSVGNRAFSIEPSGHKRSLETPFKLDSDYFIAFLARTDSAGDRFRIEFSYQTPNKNVRWKPFELKNDGTIETQAGTVNAASAAPVWAPNTTYLVVCKWVANGDHSYTKIFDINAGTTYLTEVDWVNDADVHAQGASGTTMLDAWITASTVGVEIDELKIGTTYADVVQNYTVNIIIPVDPFPAVADPLGLIVNSDFTQSTNETFSGKATYRVTGSNGDYPSNDGNYADVVGWTHYNEDPSALATYTDPGEVLDGTDKLSTSYKPVGLIYLSSAMDYRNGMVQTDILNGVAINTNLDYDLSIDVAQNASKDHSLTTFTTALTAGSGAAATNVANAIAGMSLTVVPTTNLPTALGTPYTLSISGADLIAAQSGGEVNVMFDSLNTDTISNFPAGPLNPLDATEMSQLFVGNVSLTFVSPAGDGNKNGIVDREDLQIAQNYLAGAGGDPATVRQDSLINQGWTTNDALAFLNLELYDMDGDGYFDAADVALIDAVAVPFLIQLNDSGSALDIEWSNLPGKLYDLESRDGLSVGDWSAYEGNTNIPADASGINSVTNVPATDPTRFFRVIEK